MSDNDDDDFEEDRNMGHGRNLIFYFLFSFLQFCLRLLFVVVHSTFMLNSLFICVLFWFSFLYHLSPLSTLEYILVEATCINPLHRMYWMQICLY